MPTSFGSQIKLENYRETSTSASLITVKSLTVWITTHWKILQEMGITRPPYRPPEKPVCRSRSSSQSQTQNNGMVQNRERSITKLYIVILLYIYLTYMQSISCKMLGWMNHRLESRLPGEISTTSDMQITPPLWQKAKRN